MEDTAWNTTKCQHCGTVSRVSDDRLRLEILVWACPKCGFNNEREVKFCAKCGQALLHNCPYCSSETRAATEFCENCGINFAEGAVITAWMERIRHELPKYGRSPALRARIAEGPFAQLFGACTEALGRLKVKRISTNPQAGQITGVLQICTVTVVLQPDTKRHRGIVVICTRNRPAIVDLWKMTRRVADQVAEAIWAEVRVLPPAIRCDP